MIVPDGYVIDHINNDVYDVRVDNLRAVTPGQNSQNSRKRKSKHEFVGLYYRVERPNNPWTANITVRGKRHYLGSFGTPEEAEKAYDVAAMKSYPDTEGAPRLNF